MVPRDNQRSPTQPSFVNCVPEHRPTRCGAIVRHVPGHENEITGLDYLRAGEPPKGSVHPLELAEELGLRTLLPVGSSQVKVREVRDLERLSTRHCRVLLQLTLARAPQLRGGTWPRGSSSASITPRPRSAAPGTAWPRASGRWAGRSLTLHGDHAARIVAPGGGARNWSALAEHVEEGAQVFAGRAAGAEAT